MNLSPRQWHKIVSGAIMLSAIPPIIYIQLHWRQQVDDPTLAHMLGLAPNFLSGIAIPFALLLFDPDYEVFKKRRFWYYNTGGFLLLVIHEYERFTANHAFDLQDLAVSLAGLLVADFFYFGVVIPLTRGNQ